MGAMGVNGGWGVKMGAGGAMGEEWGLRGGQWGGCWGRGGRGVTRLLWGVYGVQRGGCGGAHWGLFGVMGRCGAEHPWVPPPPPPRSDLRQMVATKSVENVQLLPFLTTHVK